MRIDAIQPAGNSNQNGQSRLQPAVPSTPSFSETLSVFLNDVNDAQKASSQAQQDLLSGRTNDVHSVAAKGEEANVAFNMLMELRNKGLEGLLEIQRIRL